MPLRTNVSLFDGHDVLIQAPFAADLRSRISDGDLTRGEQCTTDWLRRLTDAERERLGTCARRMMLESESEPDPDEALDIVMTTWLLRCLEDPSLPLSPPEPLTQSEADLMATSQEVFVVSLHVILHQAINQRKKKVDVGALDVTDDRRIRLTDVARDAIIIQRRRN